MGHRFLRAHCRSYIIEVRVEAPVELAHLTSKISRAPQIGLGTWMRDIGKRTNTAVAGLQCKVNAMTVTYCRSRFRHKDTDVRSTLKGLWLSPSDL